MSDGKESNKLPGQSSSPLEVDDGTIEMSKDWWKDNAYKTVPGLAMINQPEYSDWQCYLFGNRPDRCGMIIRPVKGGVPNRFVRWMMWICFDCLWVKD